METWIPLLISFVVAIPGVLAWLDTRKKAPAEATDIYTGAARKIIDALASRLDSVTTRLDSVEKDLRQARDDLDKAESELGTARAKFDEVERANDRLRNVATQLLEGVKKLVEQVVAQGGVPVWVPTASLLADLNGIQKRPS